MDTVKENQLIESKQIVIVDNLKKLSNYENPKTFEECVNSSLFIIQLLTDVTTILNLSFPDDDTIQHSTDENLFKHIRRAANLLDLIQAIYTRLKQQFCYLNKEKYGSKKEFIYKTELTIISSEINYIIHGVFKYFKQEFIKKLIQGTTVKKIADIKDFMLYN